MFFSNTRWTQILAPQEILMSKISLKYIFIHIHNFEHSRVIMNMKLCSHGFLFHRNIHIFGHDCTCTNSLQRSKDKVKLEITSYDPFKLCYYSRSLVYCLWKLLSIRLRTADFNLYRPVTHRTQQYAASASGWQRYSHGGSWAVWECCLGRFLLSGIPSITAAPAAVNSPHWQRIDRPEKQWLSVSPERLV